MHNEVNKKTLYEMLMPTDAHKSQAEIEVAKSPLVKAVSPEKVPEDIVSQDGIAKVISFMTQKGGVGKTTITNCLSAYLNKEGYRVLTIDMDSQGSLSFSMGINTEICATIYDVFKGDIKPRYAIQRTSMGDIIPSNVQLCALEFEHSLKEREFLLRRALKDIINFYDYILIDCPPGVGFLTVNALAASDYVIIPTMPDILSLHGVSLVQETIRHIQTTCNPDLKIAGILLNNSNRQAKYSKEILSATDMIASKYSIPVFKTIIRNSPAIAEAQLMQADITTIANSDSEEIEDFTSLISELSEKGI